MIPSNFSNNNCCNNISKSHPNIEAEAEWAGTRIGAEDEAETSTTGINGETITSEHSLRCTNKEGGTTLISEEINKTRGMDRTKVNNVSTARDTITTLDSDTTTTTECSSTTTESTDITETSEESTTQTSTSDCGTETTSTAQESASTTEVKRSNLNSAKVDETKKETIGIVNHRLKNQIHLSMRPHLVDIPYRELNEEDYKKIISKL